MSLKELLWMVYANQLSKAIDDIVNAEWHEIEEFVKIVNGLANEIAICAMDNNSFPGYSYDDLMEVIEDEICTGFHNKINGWK